MHSITTQAAIEKHEIFISTYTRFSLWEEEADASDCDNMEIEDVDNVRLFSDKKKIKSYECKEKDDPLESFYKYFC